MGHGSFMVTVGTTVVAQGTTVVAHSIMIDSRGRAHYEILEHLGPRSHSSIESRARAHHEILELPGPRYRPPDQIPE